MKARSLEQEGTEGAEAGDGIFRAICEILFVMSWAHERVTVERKGRLQCILKDAGSLLLPGMSFARKHPESSVSAKAYEGILDNRRSVRSWQCTARSRHAACRVGALVVGQSVADVGMGRHRTTEPGDDESVIGPQAPA